MNFKSEITNKIIQALEKGVTPWQCPFERCSIPVNYKTKQRYNGINTLSLWLSAILRGYTSNYWLGFSQAKSLKGKVKKGEKATSVIVCMTKAKSDESDDREVITPFFKTADPVIRYQGEKAYFSLSEDFINMPFKSKFKDNEGFYSTLFHELIHWTGHKSRLDRLDKLNRENHENRAFEELVAEIGASFLCAEYGIKPNIENTSSYVASWLKELKNNPNYIFKACREANSALNYLKELVLNKSKVA
ncbi:MAG: zincin-like metallopeptidase domain-containing protein [Candidatus Gastranaerophilales bacterium]|nr:zincin-like metallopeptidase domain-containing protein [Candidatus Gastranaerophilales bacterium]